MTLNFNDIPNDIMQLIFKHNRNQVVIDKNKKNYSLMVKHLDLYFNEAIDQDDDPSPEFDVCFIGGDPYIDYLFIDDENLWGTHWSEMLGGDQHLDQISQMY